MSEINFKIDQTVEWLRGKVKEANCNGLVVGVSGDRFGSSCIFNKKSISGKFYGSYYEYKK